MKTRILVLVSATSLLLSACLNNSKIDNAANKNATTVASENEIKLTDISFAPAKNYFVKNTVLKLDNPKIETAVKFNEIFGMATTMGEEGKPTKIDFTTQYVIACILPETDLMTTIEPVSLQKNPKGEITLSYKSVVGEKQTYTTIPNFAILVNKSENGKITLKEIK